MPYVEVSLPVQCEPVVAYPFIKDMEKYPEFMPDLLSVTVVERTAGSTVSDWVSNVDGRIIKWRELDLFDDADMHIVYKQLAGDLKKFEGEWRLLPLANGTEIRLTVDFDFGIPMIAGLLNPILKKKVRDNSMNMLRCIKEKIENNV
ncbi:type II toxin-antitoxin system RatA family toxin [Propionispora hippei]|uniref:Ribosome association toxin PasT (RatA) of the RatAB toxin-antitoxin module n=1 Tax=Propionispora hippei DSM 15287 TaxID=1123003 RepID=A0A1M6CR08_9FIRM|nr:aromatase/cyclase [Propionispora hippei]SHI63452.1 Ribosome association toxin PasT (RatA) of the RatAB toxin-antitoxin module [Propionispora hippei DSM 15287]